MHVFIYTKSNKFPNVFIYKTPDTSQKARQFLLRFYIQKARHFTFCNFHENFEVGIYIQKAWYFAVREVFIYKIQTLRKKQDNLRYVLYTKIRTLCITQFSWIFLKLEEKGGIFICKKNHFALIFFVQKQMHFESRFIYKKPDNLRYIFLCKKMKFTSQFYM